MQTEDMRLDGNAAGGMLREVFALDVTAALARCAGCGSVGPMGALLEYGHAMGVVLRCPTCDNAVMRMTHTPGFIRIDPSGIAFLMIPDGGSQTTHE